MTKTPPLPYSLTPSSGSSVQMWKCASVQTANPQFPVSVTIDGDTWTGIGTEYLHTCKLTHLGPCGARLEAAPPRGRARFRPGRRGQDARAPRESNATRISFSMSRHRIINHRNNGAAGHPTIEERPGQRPALPDAWTRAVCTDDGACPTKPLCALRLCYLCVENPHRAPARPGSRPTPR